MAVLTRDTVELNYQQTGSGTPATFVHGLGTNLAFWYLGPGRYLSDDLNMLLYDLRGHGRSSMPGSGYTLDAMVGDLHALHQKLGINTTHLVGHSYGARVALAYALRHPEAVKSLTLADTQIRRLQPNIRLRDWPHWPVWKQELLAQGATNLPDDDKIIDFTLLAELSRYMGNAAKGPGVPGLGARAGGRRRINMGARKMGQRGQQNWQDLLAKTSADNELHDEGPLSADAISELSVPTLLLYGKLSHCVPTSEVLLDLMPNARRMLIPGAGHFFPVVKPRLFARAFSEFRTKVDGAASPQSDVRPPRLVQRRMIRNRMRGAGTSLRDRLRAAGSEAGQ